MEARGSSENESLSLRQVEVAWMNGYWTEASLVSSFLEIPFLSPAQKIACLLLKCARIS